MAMIESLGSAIECLQLDDRVEMKVLIKDLILLIDKKIDTLIEMTFVLRSPHQLDNSYSKEAIIFFENEIEMLGEEVDFLKEMADNIKIEYDSL